jgi:hypothetical protein
MRGCRAAARFLRICLRPPASFSGGSVRHRSGGAAELQSLRVSLSAWRGSCSVVGPAGGRLGRWEKKVQAFAAGVLRGIPEHPEAGAGAPAERQVPDEPRWKCVPPSCAMIATRDMGRWPIFSSLGTSWSGRTLPRCRWTARLPRQAAVIAPAGSSCRGHRQPRGPAVRVLTASVQVRVAGAVPGIDASCDFLRGG